MNKNEKFCPQCPNHCPVESLSCGRGRAYFGVDDSHSSSHKNFDEQSIAGLLRQCGHMLHHNQNITNDDICKHLTNEEQNILKGLLKKILSNEN